MKNKIDLTTQIAGLAFKNPVTVASGTFGTKDEFSKFFSYEKLGAVITKTVTRHPREGNPMPRICETPSGMLNSIGLQNKGIDEFIEDTIPYFKKINTHLIVNIAGENIEDFAYLAKRLDAEKGVSALELNLSCPNVAHGLEFCDEPKLAYDLIKAVKESTKLPVFAKISPEARDFLALLEAITTAGVNGISAINTIRGMAVDVERRKPKLARVMGGLSGPAIKPIALRYCYEIKSRFQIPVIAMGGISNARDALEFIITGADLVAIGSANFVDPNASVKVVKGIEDYLKEHKLRTIGEVRGTLQLSDRIKHDN